MECLTMLLRIYARRAARDLPTEAEWEFGGLDSEDYAGGKTFTPEGGSWQTPCRT